MTSFRGVGVVGVQAWTGHMAPGRCGSQNYQKIGK
jgi:hypothetical protein